MTLATCSGARGPLLSQSWSKSKGGMFEILHLLFWKNVRRHGKNWSNTIKYIWKSSSGSELYRGISVFIPRRQENIKKQYRNKVEKWRVSEARPLILPSCQRPQMTVGRAQVAVQRPKVAVKRPQVAVQRTKVTVRKPHVAVRRPQVTVRRPQVAVNRPQVAILRPKVTIQMLTV